MKNLIKQLFCLGVFLLGAQHSTFAQQQDISFQQNFNQGLIRIAETGQLADTLNLWGDVRTTGKYLVPRNTNLTDLISYARGPVGVSEGQTWSKVNLKVYVSRYNNQTNQYGNQSFTLNLNEPLPQEMKNFSLKNGDLITVKADRKPSFRDYFTIIAPILSLGLTTYLAINTARR